MRSYTLEEVRNSYAQKRDWERQFPVSFYLFRPLSFPLTAILSNLTNSPQLIAWAGLGVGAAACALLVMRDSFGPWPGIAGLAIFALLDAVDGNMARVTGTVTRYGRLLDGALGKLVEGSYLPALSSGLYLCSSPDSGGFPWLLISGFLALTASLYCSSMENAFDALRAEARPENIRPPTAVIGSSRFRGNPFYSVFINLHAFNLQVTLLVLAAATGMEPLFLASMSAYYLLRLAVVFPYYLSKGRSEL